MTVPKDTENGVDIEVSEKSWLPFYIQMPPDVTTDVEVTISKHHMVYNYVVLHNHV